MRQDPDILPLLESISASLGDLVAATESAHTDGLQSIATAMSELVALMEAERKREPAEDGRTEEGLRAIAEAVRSIKLPAPQVKVEPKFAPVVNVPAQPLELTVKAGDTHVTVQHQDDQTWKGLSVTFTYRGGDLVAADITRKD